jgi:hypothetical protein
MPITEPNPHNILDALRATLAQLQALAAARPGNVLPKVAIGTLEATIVAVAELAREAPAA